ncbi:hypothetical protein B0H63DRAFT_551464 [Podospora didyma]|uniref:GS catalytic domain-containing protein n=1 Tax=Podospora didyma TaxID=330526 RepID=A0AAE0N6J9_9PEZI|nr:hypothetical protein B0H63DRAFT_551464 [Podospora didyma]
MRIFHQFLGVEHPEVVFVRLQRVDFTSTLRTRTVRIAPRPRQNGNKGEKWLLLPGWTSLCICGTRPINSCVMCFIACDSLKKDPNAFCPRTRLSRTLDAYEDLVRENVGTDSGEGLHLKVGFAIECVMPDAPFPRPTTARSLDRTSAVAMITNLPLLEGIVAKLEVAGIKVKHFHNELRNHFAIALEPQTAVFAVDGIMRAQETIRAVCYEHQLTSLPLAATQHPVSMVDHPLDGCHIYMTMNHALSGTSFLAGILHKLLPLRAFGFGNMETYCTGNRWDYKNPHFTDRVKDMHFRFLDLSANHIYFLNLLIRAGIQGKRHDMLLPADPSVLNCVANETDGGGAHYKVTDPKPATFADAVEAAKEDVELQRLSRVR